MGGVKLPQKAREALGLPARGPLPRSFRYRAQVEASERILVGAMPKAAQVLVDLLDDPDPKVRGSAASQVFDRVLGRSAQAATAPADDRELPPVDAGTAGELLRAALKPLSTAALDAMRDLAVDDLRAQGLLPCEGDSLPTWRVS